MNEIGYYQLENLIKNKIPFLLYDFSNEKKLELVFAHFNSYYLDFLKSQIKCIDPNDIKHFYISMDQKKESPIVLICSNGEFSKEVAESLVSKGFLNVFIVKEGLQGLQKESQETP